MGSGRDNKISGTLDDSFFVRRVFQRWCRGEIDTDMAAELLSPTNSQRALGTWNNANSASRSVTFPVALEIDPARVGRNQTVGMVGLRLVQMGGSFVYWKPDADRSPAVAQFEFSTPGERDRFVAEALDIPGVSLVRPRLVRAPASAT